jgi:ATP-binding cassette subfamily F protein 3
MLVFDAVELRRGSKVLLQSSDLRVFPGQKVALVGANGCGKSSLFKLVLGELALDQGHYEHPRSWRVAHMAQEVDTSERTAMEYVLDGHQALRQAEQRVQQAEAMGDEAALVKGLATLDDLQAYEQPTKAKQLLAGLGFALDQMTLAVASFSGGWRIRLNLAQALMQPSDLLLLDEPTNHLDLDAALWLEQWLQRYQGTLLLVSHDRDFIDAVSDVIVHIEHQKLNAYTGNYSAFERARAEALALQQNLFEKQQRQIAHMEDFIRRFRAKASKARQAQSRIKSLERMEKIQAANVDSPFEFKIPCHDQFSEPLLTLSEASLGYQGAAILEQVQCSVYPGNRIGLLGHNGAGKSTLMKTLVGDLAVLQGERTEGEHLRIGYFAQHQLEALDLEASPTLHIQRLSPNAREQEIRNFLGGYGFQGDRAMEACGPFSGGEKARLALALVAWQRPNLLLMDEPTNHLDIQMRQALINALLTYEGAMVVISHDRHLLAQTVDDFWRVDHGRVTPFEGDLDDYQQAIKQSASNQAKAKTSKVKPAKHKQSKEKQSKPDVSTPQVVFKNPAPSTPEARKERKQQRAALRALLSPLKKRMGQLERAIEELQQRLVDLEQTLANTDLYTPERKQELQTYLTEQHQAKEALEQTEQKWFDVHEEIERLEQEQGED